MGIIMSSQVIVGGVVLKFKERPSLMQRSLPIMIGYLGGVLVGVESTLNE